MGSRETRYGPRWGAARQGQCAAGAPTFLSACCEWWHSLTRMSALPVRPVGAPRREWSLSLAGHGRLVSGLVILRGAGRRGSVLECGVTAPLSGRAPGGRRGGLLALVPVKAELSFRTPRRCRAWPRPWTGAMRLTKCQCPGRTGPLPCRGWWRSTPRSLSEPDQMRALDRQGDACVPTEMGLVPVRSGALATIGSSGAYHRRWRCLP